MAITTLNQIIANLSEIAVQHRQLHNFKFGNPAEFYTSGVADCAEMWCQVNTATVSRNTMTYSFRVWVLDGVKRGELNENEVLSDMALIANDIIAQLRHPDYDWVIDFADNQTLNFFTEYSPYKWAGVWFDVDIELKYPNNRCAIPFITEPTKYPIIT